MSQIDVLNSLGMIRPDDPAYVPEKIEKGWDDLARALEQYQSPQAKRILARLRNRKQSVDNSKPSA